MIEQRIIRRMQNGKKIHFESLIERTTEVANLLVNEGYEIISISYVEEYSILTIKK